MPPYLRKALGNQWWSEPCEVNFNASAWEHTPTKRDVELFCSIVGDFPRLREFRIESEHFTCDLIQDWPTLATLEDLQVESPRLRDGDIGIVASMSNLDHLRIESATITNHGIRGLARLPRLKSLGLDDIKISASDRSPIEGFPELFTLSISDTPGFNDAIACTWGPLPKLNDLSLRNTTLGDRGLAHLLTGAKLASIDIEGGLVSDESLPELARHNLRWLGLSELPITDDAIAALASQQIRSLVLNNTEITDSGLATIANFSALDFLILSETKITGSAVVQLKKVSNLHYLSLNGCDLSTQGIEDVARLKCSQLSLAQTPIDDEQLLRFADHDHLLQLHVAETNVTAAGVQAFCEARKRHFQMTGKKDDLWLSCDFPDVVRKYYNR